jgi:hypothetical protein
VAPVVSINYLSSEASSILAVGLLIFSWIL